ncbi:MAG: hypothetical protein K2X48_15320 [Chitinophagaceae bacterium]|nr:hypothetical protein [Chitinophagaceae bacterium]
MPAQINSNASSVITNLSDAIGKAVTNNIVFYKGDMPGLAEGIPAYRITGSRFWNDAWIFASLYDGNDKLLGRIPVKLNLNYSSVHYMDKKGNELALDPEQIRKVVFLKDTFSLEPVSIFVSYLPYIYVGKQKVNDYVRVMNQGKAALIKYERRNIGTADSAFGTQKRYFFKSETFYYLWFNNKAEEIKRLNKDALLQLLPGASVYEEWIAANRINLKKEEDVVKFLEYYNSQK